MFDFNYFTPTKVAFGKNTENRVAELIKEFGGKKVLIHYGGGSVVRSGLMQRVTDLLDKEGIAYVKLGGAVPNPRLSLVYEGIELCRKEGIDFLLAVGGGSVIDSAKAIGYGVMNGGDVWDFYDYKRTAQACMPIGVILTLAATGSEMSDSSVITKEEGLVKRGYSSDFCRPRFAILNPELTMTLPDYQTACGCTDIMMHTMERYFSKYEDALLTDAIAEALLRTVKEATPKVLKNPEDYPNRAAIMWASSLSHNDLTECGTEKDFASHKLEHELSGLFGVTHGAGLAAIWGSWARYVMDKHLNRFMQFAVNVMGVHQDFTDAKATALQGIEAAETFFSSIGMPISVPQLIGRQMTDDEINIMVEKCSRGGKLTLGAMEVLAADDMRKIYQKANK